ncbi:hypothetical protein [aff. Roholtiella sp. LEGE 12411]|uniref:hypothetical protein n=1 Tax=aff. Roholtiella sp. LEGE 12411 TaxID=1828822 RepID=UPI00187E2869|nr:hypothetical protein [aff. Roholtiella sp. LEGE 12411]MBE9036422.1 hypothetical protein [aff. Roholtiella sp. LEGE 12411]
MAVRQDTIWERFLSPVVRLLIDEEGLRRYADSIDWEKQSDRLRREDVIIPPYYIDIFEEPYIREYAAGSLDASMGAAGFEVVRTQDVWWINQVTSGVKPIPTEDTTVQKNVKQYSSTSIDTTIDNNDLEGLESPAFGVMA